jgi:phosphatidylinositol 3-kinase
MFQAVFDRFIVQLSTADEEGKMLFKRLCALDEYIAKISACQRDAREQRGRKEAKEQALQKLLEERQLSTIPRGVDWIPMPLDPSIQLMGLIPNTASMFASAVYPCVIEFLDYADYQANAAATAAAAASGGKVPPPKAKPKTHKIMFKSGDDLRQDQLIMQMISLMDRLLKKVNLDLKLLTYGILAVSQKDGTLHRVFCFKICTVDVDFNSVSLFIVSGIMEFCRNSMPISAVLKNFNGSISDYLRHHNHDKSAPGEIAPM